MIISKLCDRLKILFQETLKLNFNNKRTNSPNNNSKAQSKSNSVSVAASSNSGSAIAFNTHELHLHDTESRRVNRLKGLRKINEAARSLGWAIDQSKDPRNRNTPGAYQKKLRDTFEEHFTSLSMSDIEILDPLINASVRSGNFQDLVTPYQNLSQALNALTSSNSKKEN